MTPEQVERMVAVAERIAGAVHGTEVLLWVVFGFVAGNSLFRGKK